MPRGDKSSHPDTLAKRANTTVQRRKERAQRKAAIVLKKGSKDILDVQAKQAWLSVKGIDLADPAMGPADRLRWAQRATAATRRLKCND